MPPNHLTSHGTYLLTSLRDPSVLRHATSYCPLKTTGTLFLGLYTMPSALLRVMHRGWWKRGLGTLFCIVAICKLLCVCANGVIWNEDFIHLLMRRNYAARHTQIKDTKHSFNSLHKPSKRKMQKHRIPCPAVSSRSSASLHQRPSSAFHCSCGTGRAARRPLQRPQEPRTRIVHERLNRVWG